MPSRRPVSFSVSGGAPSRPCRHERMRRSRSSSRPRRLRNNARSSSASTGSSGRPGGRRIEDPRRPPVGRAAPRPQPDGVEGLGHHGFLGRAEPSDVATSSKHGARPQLTAQARSARRHAGQQADHVRGQADGGRRVHQRLADGLLDLVAGLAGERRAKPGSNSRMGRMSPWWPSPTRSSISGPRPMEVAGAGAYPAPGWSGPCGRGPGGRRRGRASTRSPPPRREPGRSGSPRHRCGFGFRVGSSLIESCGAVHGFLITIRRRAPRTGRTSPLTVNAIAGGDRGVSFEDARRAVAA